MMYNDRASMNTMGRGRMHPTAVGQTIEYAGNWYTVSAIHSDSTVDIVDRSGVKMRNVPRMNVHVGRRSRHTRGQSTCHTGALAGQASKLFAGIASKAKGPRPRLATCTGSRRTPRSRRTSGRSTPTLSRSTRRTPRSGPPTWPT